MPRHSLPCRSLRTRVPASDSSIGRRSVGEIAGAEPRLLSCIQNEIACQRSDPRVQCTGLEDELGSSTRGCGWWRCSHIECVIAGSSESARRAVHCICSQPTACVTKACIRFAFCFRRQRARCCTAQRSMASLSTRCIPCVHLKPSRNLARRQRSQSAASLIACPAITNQKRHD
jgi:hypothetical protein